MGYEKNWDLTVAREGRETKFSSPKGYAVVVKDEKGWVATGEVVLATTDTRVVKPPVEGEKFDDVNFLRTPERMKSLLGKFEFRGKNKSEAIRCCRWRLAVVKTRVAFEQLDEPTAEAARDWNFFTEQLAECAKNGNPLDRNKAAYQMLVLDEWDAPKAHKPTKEKVAASNISGLLNELNSLTGLDRIKTDVNQLVDFLKVQNLREQMGLSAPERSLHMVFTGNPGTGKTTIARLVSQIYKSMSILSGGQFVETDRTGLIGGYLGQTGLKTKAVVKSAIGGVLFIDEAYSLTDDTHGRDMYGQEAVATLLKLMEDHREDLIVIVAGYTEPMQKFISSNPGLQSRFNKFLHFDDYAPAELTEIFRHFAAQGDYKLHPATELKLTNVFTSHYARRDETFGNARLARNLFEKAINAHANRMVSVASPDEESLVTLYPEDVPNA